MRARHETIKSFRLVLPSLQWLSLGAVFRSFAIGISHVPKLYFSFGSLRKSYLVSFRSLSLFFEFASSTIGGFSLELGESSEIILSMRGKYIHKKAPSTFTCKFGGNVLKAMMNQNIGKPGRENDPLQIYN